MSGAPTRAEIESILDDEDRRALNALIEVYGDDTDTIINAMHSMATRIAILGGVQPEDFAAGVKHHWDACAAAMANA